MNYLGKVLIAAPVHEVLTSGLQAIGYELLIPEDINQSMAMMLVKDCVGVVTSNRLQIDREMIDAAPNLRFIARMGSGMEVIDVPYAQGKGISCIGSPEGNCNAVAEHALGMLLSLNKKIEKSFTELKQGVWLREENRGTELEGKTIGIIGYGHTGTAFAKLLRGFNLRILVYDKYKKIATEPHIEVCATIDKIMQDADIVSVHVPFQEDTFHIIDEGFVEQMKKPFVLLNTSRGTVVDGAIMKRFLENRKILGLGLDVWEEEPLSKMSVQMLNMFNELIILPNVLLTPHIAGYSHEALYKMSRTLLERITK